MATELRVAESGVGPPLVLLHAFPLNASMWSAQATRLAGGWRVLCPDQRGFGGSPLPAGDGPDMDLLADDVADLLDARGIAEPVVLAGLSMGGYVAMAFWRRHRARVRALILADTKAAADTPAAAAARERIAAEVLAAGTAAQLVTESLPKLVGTTTAQQRPDVVARVQRLIESAPAEGVAWAQRAMAARPDSVPMLQMIDVPTLVVVGAEDELTPPADAAVIADAITGASLVTIPAAGHLSAMETPEEFTEAVTHFLDALPR